MAEEDDVLAEVEAVEAVYGHDCVVLRRSPPLLRIHLKPRTADDSSKQVYDQAMSSSFLSSNRNSWWSLSFLQFVEAVMKIRAGAEVTICWLFCLLIQLPFKKNAVHCADCAIWLLEGGGMLLCMSIVCTVVVWSELRLIMLDIIIWLPSYRRYVEDVLKMFANYLSCFEMKWSCKIRSSFLLKTYY